MYGGNRSNYLTISPLTITIRKSVARQYGNVSEGVLDSLFLVTQKEIINIDKYDKI